MGRYENAATVRDTAVFPIFVRQLFRNSCGDSPCGFPAGTVPAVSKYTFLNLMQDSSLHLFEVYCLPQHF